MSNRNCGIIDGMKAWHQGLGRDETAAAHTRSSALIGIASGPADRQVLTDPASNIAHHAAPVGSR